MEAWKEAWESKGLKVNVKKTKIWLVVKMLERLQWKASFLVLFAESVQVLGA